MKKIIFLATVVLVTTTGWSQPSHLSVSDEEGSTQGHVKSSRKQGLAQLRAEEDFSKWNGDAGQVRWFDDTNGFFVYYTKDGRKGRSFYNKKGFFVYNTLSYSEQFLPPGIRRLIKSVYYLDYRITHVNEVRQDGQTTFLVTVTDDIRWTKLRVTDGEMEVMGEYGAK